MLFQVEEQAGFLLRFVYFETLASNLKSFGVENQVCKLQSNLTYDHLSITVTIFGFKGWWSLYTGLNVLKSDHIVVKSR